jgi:hypothetical protein
MAVSVGDELYNLHVMNIQTLYSRLQCDILSKYGREPQLSIDRIPLYEEFYRNFLVLIESIGSRDHMLLIISIPSGVPPRSIVPCTVSSHSGDLNHKIDVPSELVDLFSAFASSGNPELVCCLRQICLFTYKSKSHVVTPDQESAAIAGFVSRNARCQTYSASCLRRKSEEGSELNSLFLK